MFFARKLWYGIVPPWSRSEWRYVFHSSTSQRECSHTIHCWKNSSLSLTTLHHYREVNSSYLYYCTLTFTLQNKMPNRWKPSRKSIGMPKVLDYVYQMYCKSFLPGRPWMKCNKFWMRLDTWQVRFPRVMWKDSGHKCYAPVLRRSLQDAPCNMILYVYRIFGSFYAGIKCVKAPNQTRDNHWDHVFVWWVSTNMSAGIRESYNHCCDFLFD